MRENRCSFKQFLLGVPEIPLEKWEVVGIFHDKKKWISYLKNNGYRTEIVHRRKPCHSKSHPSLIIHLLAWCKKSRSQAKLKDRVYLQKIRSLLISEYLTCWFGFLFNFFFFFFFFESHCFFHWLVFWSLVSPSFKQMWPKAATMWSRLIGRTVGRHRTLLAQNCFPEQNKDSGSDPRFKIVPLSHFKLK